MRLKSFFKSRKAVTRRVHGRSAAVAGGAAAALIAVILALALSSSASAHITYACSTQYNPYGKCSVFRGFTTSSNDPSANPVDPINFAWYPWGGYDSAIYAEEQMGWTCGSGGDQYNRREWYMGQGLFDFVQESQRASGCWPDGRYHGRNFLGHADDQQLGNQWSVVDMHHERFGDHNIDMSWNQARDYAASLAYNVGFYYQEDHFTFVPLGQGNFQNYYADGWVTRVTGNPTPTAISEFECPDCQGQPATSRRANKERLS